MKNIEKQEIIRKFKPFLWSYDADKIDIDRDSGRIITNVLNYGTKEVTDLLRQVYEKERIKEVIKNPKPGEWDNKSLNYWSIIYNIWPINIKNVLRHIG